MTHQKNPETRIKITEYHNENIGRKRISSLNILGVISIFIALLAIAGCDNGPDCGGSCNDGQQCINNTCMDTGSGDGQESSEDICDHECCNSSGCEDHEECIENECIEIECGYCEVPDDHGCTSLACCKDSECDDYDDITDDICLSPGTELSECKHELTDECQDDEDCDDDDPSTEDSCRDSDPKVCFNEYIKECISNDDYCPIGCDYQEDHDCEKTECGFDDIDCLVDALEECSKNEGMFDADWEEDGLEWDMTTMMTIDKEDGNCMVRIKTESVSVRLSDEEIEDLEDDGYSDDEIDEIEDDAKDEADSMEGDEWICILDDTDAIIEMIGDWEDGNYESDDLADLDCEKEQCKEGDLDCFIDALEECDENAISFEFEWEDDEEQWQITTSVSIEDEGDGVCEIDFETDDIKVRLTDDFIEELEDDDYDDDEIDEIEEERQDDAEDLEGDEWTCFFEDTDDLIDILKDWEDGEYDLDDFNGFDCSGDI